MTIFKPENGWGPDGRRAALSITFDNMGEAAWIEMDMWGDRPVGEHFTAAFVPRLIDVLGDAPATYFIEASNAALYPDAILRWHAAGHEVGLHAWRHEAWDRTAAGRRVDILQRSLAAMRAIGVDPVGFRPPGGKLPFEAYAEFEQAGLLYCSDLGPQGIRQVGDLLVLPFAWQQVDSYVTEPLAAPLRAMFGDPDEAAPLATWQDQLDRMLQDALDEGGQRTIIFHPEFIGASDDKLAVLVRLIERATAAGLWIACARDVAGFVANEIARIREPA